MARFVEVGLLLILHFFTIGISDDDLLTTEQLQKLDDYIEEVMTCRNVPGLTLAIVQDDHVLTRAYGKTDLEKNVNTTTDSIFCIASNTKALTTTLLSKLLPQKFPQSVWDTKVRDILGESFKFNDDSITKAVTLKDILCHRTGFRRGDIGWVAGYPDNFTRAEMAKRLDLIPVERPFRYTFGYNNWMYFLAGYVAEVISGGDASWEDLMKEHIFRPLSMDSTIFTRDLRDQPAEKVAWPYLYYDDSYHKLSLDSFRIHPLEAAGGVCSTANDMAKLLQFYLQAGSAPPWEDIVDAGAMKATMEPYQIMYYPHTSRPKFPVSDFEFGYGLGWASASYRGLRKVRHGGWLGTHASDISLYPDLKMGIFLSVNAQNPGVPDPKAVIVYYISDILFGEDPWLNGTTACTFPDPWLKSPQWNTTSTEEPVYKPQRPLEEYAGIYGSELYGDMHISVNTSGQGEIQMEFGLTMQGSLFPAEQKDVFYWKVSDHHWTRPFTSLNDRFHFYASNGGKELNALNVTITRQFMSFHCNVRFRKPSKSLSGANLYRCKLAYLLILILMSFEVR